MCQHKGIKWIQTTSTYILLQMPASIILKLHLVHKNKRTDDKQGCYTNNTIEKRNFLKVDHIF